MSVQILNLSDTCLGPISAEELKSIFLGEVQNLNESKEAARHIAQKLSTKSSKHKFLVLVTRIDLEPEVSNDVSIQSVIGAVWDEKKDGYWAFRVDDELIHLITVYWIFVG